MALNDEPFQMVPRDPTADPDLANLLRLLLAWTFPRNVSDFFAAIATMAVGFCHRAYFSSSVCGCGCVRVGVFLFVLFYFICVIYIYIYFIRFGWLVLFFPFYFLLECVLSIGM